MSCLRVCLTLVSTFFLSVSQAPAANYWVATNGNNSNPGTQALPWLTIGHAASVAQTNDIVRVTPGNYYETVTPAHSGAQGTNITYLGIGQPVVFSFQMGGLNNWSIIGFHFIMTNVSQYYDSISLNKCTNFQILSNWFDHIYPLHGCICTSTATNNWPNYCAQGLVRENFFDHVGIGSYITNSNYQLTEAMLLNGMTQCLVEYNTVQCAHNMILVEGAISNVIRNNYFHDVEVGYFITPYYTNTPHVDSMQGGVETGSTTNTFRTLFECNRTVSNDLPNSKFVIAQNQYANASIGSISDYIIRKNAVTWQGSYVFLFDDVYNMRTYNNTFANILWINTNSAGSKPNYCMEASTNYCAGTNHGAILPTNEVVINSIFYAANNPSDGIIFNASSNVSSAAPYYDVFANNLTFQSGPVINQTSGGDITNTDPQFVSISNLDAHLTNTSPAIARSRPQTTTTAGGSSTTVVPVVDAGFFTDGWGIQWVNGDVVDVGTNSGVQIASINYPANTLTLVSPITFNNGDGVFLDGTQDIGAYKYDPNGYSYGITLTSPTNLATTPGTTALTATVTNPSKVRIVRFYVDGLEVGNAAPAPVVSINAVISGTNNVVQARAYALYADTNLVMGSSVTVNPIPMVAPGPLIIQSTGP
jgi:hypothetical protein